MPKERRWLIPLIYVLTLFVDIAYTFQISLQSPAVTVADLTHLFLIIMVVGGLWALENIAIVYAKDSKSKSGE